MKYPSPKSRSACKALFAAISALTPFGFSNAYAGDVLKDNNSTALNDAASWVGGALPGVDDVAVFGPTVTSSPFNVGLGGNLSLGGIRVAGNTGNINITGLTTLSLNLGQEGLDFSGATSGTFIDFDSPSIFLRGGTAQTWKSASGVETLLFGNLSGPGTVVFDSTNGNTGKFFGEGFGFPGAIIPFALSRTDAGLNYSTLSGGLREITPDTGALADANPSDGGNSAVNAELVAAPASGRYVDVVNSNGLATATAFRAQRTGSGAGTFWNNAGIRFNQPHATPDTDWTVDVTQRILYPDNNVFAILVTPGVTDRDVIFNGGTNGNAFRFNNANATMVIHQHNTAGDLILRTSFSARATGHNFTKSGEGRLIMGNPGFHSAGASTVFLAEGVTQLGESNATGTFGGLPIVNNSTLRLQRSDAFTLGNLVSGSGDLEVAMGATGNLTLTAANTFTGKTTLESGTLTLGNATALGTPSAIDLQSGSLVFGAGIANDLSVAPITLSGDVTLNTGTNNVVFANSIGAGGAGGLTKTGAGSLTLAGANTYQGNTSVSAGTLRVSNVSGSATGAGDVSIAAGSTLTGGGTISGSVSTATGAKIIPGDGLGTLTVGGLALASGSLLDLEFTSTSVHDRIVVTDADSLSINGGGILLYGTGTTDAYATAGTYQIIQHNGTVQGAGASALSVLNPQAGYTYTFGSSGGFVTLDIVLDAIITQWSATGAGSWNSGSNWTNGVPTEGYTALFTTPLGTAATVTLDGNRTVNGMVFDSANGYTLAQGTSGNLTFFKSGSSAATNIITGDHQISAPVVLSSSISATAEEGASLTISGGISGAGGIIKAGDGLLDLTGNNSFSGAVQVVGGVLGFTQASGLGTGDLTLNGGSLLFNSGNTNDISTKTITFGLDGAGIDTGGNDVVLANPVGNGGIGAFSKLGEGSLTFAANNTYGGDTFLFGGELVVTGNGSLGDPALGRSLRLEGGFLVPSATLTLDNAGANARPVVVGAGGGGFLVPSEVTLTVPGAMSGSGALTKTGAGTLLLSANNSAFTGAVNLEAGTVSLGNDRAIGQTGLGTGLITFTDDAQLDLNGVGINDNGATFGGIANGINVPAGVNATLRTPARGAYTGALTGEGTINIAIDGNRFDVPANWPAFAGQIVIDNVPTGDGLEVDEFRMSGVQNIPGGRVRVAPGVQMTQTFNPPNNGGIDGITTFHTYGELTVDLGGFLSGNTVAGRFTNYTVGALNTDFAIDGQMRPVLGLFGNSYPSLTKTGTGTLTLNNSHLTTGQLRVSGGTLKVLGAVERFYTGIGADNVYGRPPTGNSDDPVFLTPPEGDFVVTEPGAVIVDALGTLAGNGRLGGLTTVNGTLQPDASGTLGGRLSFTGAATLTLAATATTQFDFAGTAFTGVSSEVASGVTYGGVLRLNYLGTIFNGSYTLFELNGAPAGAFTEVSVTSTQTTDPLVLTQNAGVWTGTVDGASLSFDPATGVLSVSNAAPVTGLPVTPGAVDAVAGNASVSLMWNADANSDNYIVKRSTTASGPYTTLTSEVVTTSYVDNAVLNGTTYYYVIQAQNEVGFSANSVEVSATPSAPLFSALESWREDNFGTTDNADDAADNADPDADGIANLLEYATGRNPNAADATPVLAIGKNGDGSRLTVSYTRIADPTLVYTVQGGNDLTGTPMWTTVDTSTGEANVAGPVTVTDTALISANPRRFLRLQVGYSAE